MREKVTFHQRRAPSVSLHPGCVLSQQSGKIDMTFFTHDCFHFTIKGHEELAKGLWNNMVNNESVCLLAQEVKGQQSPLLLLSKMFIK